MSSQGVGGVLRLRLFGHDGQDSEAEPAILVDADMLAGGEPERDRTAYTVSHSREVVVRGDLHWLN